MRRKALPLDYYYDMDPHPGVITTTADPFARNNDSDPVVITVAPAVGNGRIREASDSIPEEDHPGESPRHHRS